jgi:tetratricopeptide (TPR) repeat protein
MTPEFHNKLVGYYCEALIELKKNNKDSQIGKVTPGLEPGIIGKIRKSLINFLTMSEHYDKGQMLAKYQQKLKDEELYEERAILLSKVGKHHEALTEYIHKLHDFPMAKNYCKKHYNTDNEEAKDVYLSLLKVYLSPQDSSMEKELQDAAYELLSEHYQEIDCSKAIEYLPETTPLSLLYPYFEKVLRDINKNRRNLQVITNLHKCETMKVKTEHLKLSSRCVKITDDTNCAVCHKRLNDVAFALYPTWTTDVPVTVHYKCFKEQKEPNTCPVTGQKFSETSH